MTTRKKRKKIKRTDDWTELLREQTEAEKKIALSALLHNIERFKELFQ